VGIVGWASADAYARLAAATSAVRASLHLCVGMRSLGPHQAARGSEIAIGRALRAPHGFELATLPGGWCNAGGHLDFWTLSLCDRDRGRVEIRGGRLAGVAHVGSGWARAAGIAIAVVIRESQMHAPFGAAGGIGIADQKYRLRNERRNRVLALADDERR